jgi:long-subunit fatty acid transport protein
MQKTFILLLLLFLANSNLTSQNSELKQQKFINNIRFGGGFNISLNNSYTTFAISPSALYDFSDEFSLGLGLTYVYVKNKSIIQRTSNLYGGSILALYRPIQYIQLSMEYEQLKLNQKINYSNTINPWQPALYIGMEYVTGNLAMGLRYDVLFDQTKNVIYASGLSPVFRLYF